MEPQQISKLRISSQETPAGGRKARRIALVLVVSVLLGLLWFLRDEFFSSTIPVQMATVGAVHPSQTVTDFHASGYVVAQTRASVASKGTGRIERLVVREGSLVKKGDVLAELENDDLEAEQAQVLSQLAALKADLVRVQIEERDAERNFRRFQALRQQGVVSQADYESAENRFTGARAAVASARANIKALEASLERISILIRYTFIVAPFDGVVLTKNADVGEVVAPFGSSLNARAAVVTMADLSSLMVEADVAESFLPRVHAGQPCEIQLDALPGVRYSGKVDTIVPTADRTKGTVTVKIRFDQLDPRILPEMSAKIAFLKRELGDGDRSSFLGVHREALVQRMGVEGLFVVENDRARWTPAAPVFRGDYLVVESLLKAGDRVIVNPPAALQPGNRVKTAE